MDKNKKYILIALIVCLILFLAISGVLAYFGWTGKEASINVSVSSGIGSCSLMDDNNVELAPTYSKFHSRKIKLNANQQMADKAYITWTMTVKEINGLKDESFFYELVNNTTGESYGSGNFANVTAGDTIVFSHDTEVLGYNMDYTFTLYLWIDGKNFDNDYFTMANQTFDIDMVCDITGTDEGTVVKQNTLMSYSSFQTETSTFLRSDLARNQINSITFLDTNEVPQDDNIKKFNVAKDENSDSIVLWYYDEANEEGLYDINIGSDGGSIYLDSGFNLFRGMTKLKSLDLSNIYTSSVIDMSFMFTDCSSLTRLDLSSFDTSSVTDMRNMFWGCSSLINLDLSSFDASKVTNMSSMFSSCSSLINLDLSSFDASKVTNMSRMFYGCSSLASLDLSGFDTSSVIDMSYMFNDCSSLTRLDLSSFDTSKVTNMSRMFSGCSSLASLDLSSFDTSSVTDMSIMFGLCSSLTSLDISGFDTSSVTDMSFMFRNCSSLINLDLSSFDTSSVTDMSAMFYVCSSLINLDLSSFDTSSVTDMSAIFRDCPSLINLDLSSFDTSAVTDMSTMFYGCGNLTTIYVSGLWNIDKVTGSGSMFLKCSKLVGGLGTTYRGSYADKTYARIDKEGDPGYFTYKAFTA